MKKKILIGSMLVLTLLLLMPSIPAIQQKSIEEGFKQEIQEKLNLITLDDLENIKDLDDNKFPLLYVIVVLIASFQVLRFVVMYKIAESSFATGTHPHPYLFIISFVRSIFLLKTVIVWIGIWEYISDELGWNWDLPYF